MIAVAINGKHYHGISVLGSIAFELQENQTLAVTGPSGIGKTTLLRIIAGLDPDFEGTVSRPERIAMVFQEPTLLPWRTARDNICLTTGASSGQADAALAEVGLEGLGDRFPPQLSLGQQRRLGLARAFAAGPDLLLMDEPFVSLDAAQAEEMLALTERLLAARSVATVFVTHALPEAERLADRIVRLEGRPAVFAPDG
ncbi:ABC transporter ATP-binding protein [Pelagibius sp.]|uniref:ABC transporter ATP-binding protein n=1 Tax=Pelagibius sp. TaxID=1931238 RepID=UPI003BB086DE